MFRQRVGKRCQRGIEVRCGLGAVWVHRDLLYDYYFWRLGREMLQVKGYTDVAVTVKGYTDVAVTVTVGWYRRRRVLCKNPFCTRMRL